MLFEFMDYANLKFCRSAKSPSGASCEPLAGEGPEAAAMASPRRADVPTETRLQVG